MGNPCKPQFCFVFPGVIQLNSRTFFANLNLMLFSLFALAAAKKEPLHKKGKRGEFSGLHQAEVVMEEYGSGNK